jgi:hypothetical protein
MMKRGIYLLMPRKSIVAYLNGLFHVQLKTANFVKSSFPPRNKEKFYLTVKTLTNG